MSSLARHRRLKKLIRKQCNEIHFLRQNRDCLYSINHLNYFYDEIIAHLTRTINRFFDFLQFNYSKLFLSMKTNNHLRNFFDLCRQSNVSKNAMIVFLTSMILLNVYSIEIHNKTIFLLDVFSVDKSWKFDFSIIYDILYEFMCFKFIKISLCTISLIQKFNNNIFEHLIEMFVEMNIFKTIVQQMHCNQLHQSFVSWLHMQNNKTCFYCLRRKSKNVLICDHDVCKTCIQTFDRVETIVEYRYRIDNCLLCRSKNFRMTLRFSIAKFRILNIDDDDVRKIVSFEHLHLFQNALNSIYKIQKFFDLIFDINFDKYRHVWQKTKLIVCKKTHRNWFVFASMKYKSI